MNTRSLLLIVAIALFSNISFVEIHGKDLSIHRFKRGLLGPTFGLGFKSSILESKFGKGVFPFAPQPPVQPAAQPGVPQPTTQPTTQPGVPQPIAQPVPQPPPIFPTFLQNIMEAKKNIIAGKFAAIQPPAGSFGTAVPSGSLTLEDVKLAEEYLYPATATKNNIIASILKLSGPMSSSSSSVEYNDE